MVSEGPLPMLLGHCLGTEQDQLSLPDDHRSDGIICLRMMDSLMDLSSRMDLPQRERYRLREKQAEDGSGTWLLLWFNLKVRALKF